MEVIEGEHIQSHQQIVESQGYFNVLGQTHLSYKKREVEPVGCVFCGGDDGSCLKLASD